MSSSTTELLEANGWVVECESPFEIRHSDGSFARDQAAHAVIDSIRGERRIVELTQALETIASAATVAEAACDDGFAKRLWEQVKLIAQKPL